MNKYLEFKEKVDKWLSSDRSDIVTGATLLLQLNKNRILHTNIIRRGNVDKLVNELTKYSEILAEKAKIEDYKSLTDEQIQVFEEKKARIEKELLPIINTNAKGLRTDHDKLPQAAKEAYEANQTLYPKIRSLHEKLKLMVNDRDCDRYPFIKQLTEFGDQIPVNWKLYDQAVAIEPKVVPPPIVEAPVIKEPVEVPPIVDDPVIVEPPVIKDITKVDPPVEVPPVVDNAPLNKLTPQKVSANRKYLSDNKKSIVSITDKTKKSELLSKMQIRLNELIADGQSVNENQLKELEELGLTIPVIKPDPTGETQ